MKTEMTPATEEKLIAFVACAGSAAGKARFANCASCKEACESGFQRGECKSGCVGDRDRFCASHGRHQLCLQDTEINLIKRRVHSTSPCGSIFSKLHIQYKRNPW